MTDPVSEQPPPAPSEGDVWLLVLRDMEERRRVGIARYGTPPQPHNGRDALADLYQELLDAVAYTRQAIAERDRPRAAPDLSADLAAARAWLACPTAYAAHHAAPAVARLCDAVERLQRDVRTAAERIAAQSDLLSRRAERAEASDGVPAR